MSKIIWISSYPKSGNTWMRYFIANYFFNNIRINDPNIIKKIKAFPNTEILRKISSKDEIIDNPYDISKYWIKSQELIKIANGNICFLKNHNALANIKNHPFTNETHSLSCIYIIRDPRDVVVSYAKYKNMNYDRAIKDICCKELLYTLSKKHVFPRVDILGSWKYHFLSWKNGMNKMPKIFVKYEDLINDSYGNFYKVIDFLSKILGFKINTEQIEFSIKCSSFKNLKKFENKMGFFENESKSDFFRSGKVGNWKNELSISQIKHIETEFKSEMKLLGYL